MPEASTFAANILAVDDSPDFLALISAVLKAGGFKNLAVESDPLRAMQRLSSSPPDLLLLDMDLGAVHGLHILKTLRNSENNGSLPTPVIAVTGSLSAAQRLEALKLGAWDILTKPFEPEELVYRATNVLKLRELERAKLRENKELELLALKRSVALARAEMEILQRVAGACELRDDQTGQHTKRVGRLSAQIARGLGFDDEYCNLVALAAPLHDVGKVGIPDAILLKPGKLTEKEVEIMRTHTVIGAQLLAGSQLELVRMAATIARCHHERWDGTGYPDGLAGDDIPMIGRIVAIADVYDALTHERPYKHAMDHAPTIELMKGGAGTQFCPTAFDAFLSVAQTLTSEDTEASLAEARGF